jgi:Kyakuja-Dileera-Zisupton transposase
MERALERGEDWNTTAVCIPCMYKLTDEEPLKFSMLAAMDGNFSLKLVDNTFLSGTPRADDRASTSSRWITPDEVDQFKEEVSRQKVHACLQYVNVYNFFSTKFSRSQPKKVLITLNLRLRVLFPL